MKNFVVFTVVLMSLGCPSAQVVKPPSDVITDPAVVIAKNDALLTEFETATFKLKRNGTKMTVVYSAPDSVSVNGESMKRTDLLGVDLSGRDVARLIRGTCAWDAFRDAGEDDEVLWKKEGGYLVRNFVGKTVGFDTATGMQADLNASMICQRMGAYNARGKVLFEFRGIDWSTEDHAWTTFTISGPKGESNVEVKEVIWGESPTDAVENLPLQAKKFFDGSFSEVAVLGIPNASFAVGISPKRVRAVLLSKDGEKIVENFVKVKPCEEGHSPILNTAGRFIVLRVDCTRGDDVLVTENVTFIFDPFGADPLDWEVVWTGEVGSIESDQVDGCAMGDRAVIEVRDDELWLSSNPWFEVTDRGNGEPASCSAPKKKPDQKIYPLK